MLLFSQRAIVRPQRNCSAMSVFRCLLALALFVVPAHAEKVAVFLAAGQSNANVPWADGLRQGLQESHAFPRFEVVHSEHDGQALIKWSQVSEPGPNYAEDLAALKQAMETIRAAGDEPVFRGFFWMQGEADSLYDSYISVYAARFNAMMERYRLDLELYEVPDFTLGVTDLNSDPLYDEDFSLSFTTREKIEALRAQQFSLAAQENGSSVDTRGMLRADAWHLPYFDAIDLGKQMAAAWVERFFIPVPVVSKAEEKAATKSFRKADRNRDGAISRGEFLGLMKPAGKARALRKSMGEEALPAIESACDLFFQWFDSDSSRTLDSGEWLAGRTLDPELSAPPLRQIHEGLIDRNGDDHVTYKEFAWVLRGVVPLARSKEWYAVY